MRENPQAPTVHPSDGEASPEAEAMPMPPAPAGDPAAAHGEKVVVPAPPTIGKQMAQLVIIPAAIVVLAIGVAVLFGRLAGTTETIDSQLMKLRQSSGAGQMRFGLQDPRYKDRGLAAYNIATMIPGIKDPAERARVSRALVEVLRQNTGEEEDLLRVYLLMAIGQLGQDEAFPVLIEQLGSPRAAGRQGAIRGVLSWPDPEHARQAVPRLAALLRDPEPTVRAEAAAALGELAKPEDEGVVEALRAAMESHDASQREVLWNAAVALARLDDPRGSRYVAHLLLDREALAKLAAGESGAAAAEPMTEAMQDRILLSTLASAREMKDPMIWDKIAGLAQDDKNLRVQKAALGLLHERRTAAEPGGAVEEAAAGGEATR